MDVLIAFFFGFVIGGGLLGITLKGILREDDAVWGCSDHDEDGIRAVSDNSTEDRILGTPYPDTEESQTPDSERDSDRI